MGLLDAPTPLPRPQYLAPQVARPQAGLLDVLTGQGGDFLGDLGVGLLQGRNWKEGLQIAGQRTAQMEPQRQAQYQAQTEKNATISFLKTKRPDLIPYIEAGFSPQQMLKIAYDEEHNPGTPEDPASTIVGRTGLAKQFGLTGAEAKSYVLTGKLPDGGSLTTDQSNWEYAQSHPGFLESMTNRGGPAETSLTASWGVDTDPNSPTYNQPVMGQLNKAGQFVKTQLPAGVQPMDPMALAGGKTGAQVDAKTAATARAALPGAEQTVAITRQAIDSIRSDPAALDEHFGKFLGIVPQQMIPVTIPGTKKAQFDVNQAQAGGQAFMQARQMLKGGGQITDYEGRRAEAAYSKMEAAASAGDKAQYLQALDEFEQAVEAGYQKLQAAANGAYSAGSDAVTGGGQPTYTYNPATGELE